MADETQQLHVAFFPFMAYGHMIPILDIASLFEARGVKVTIITTPCNLPFFTNKTKEIVSLSTIQYEVFRFPTSENGLPDGCEDVNKAIPTGMIPNFMKAVEMLQEQLEQYLEKIRPDCLVSDMFLPWTTDCAGKFDVPRLVFHGTCCFSLCAEEIVRVHMPYKNVSSDEESFTIPCLPHDIRITRLQIAEYLWKDEDSAEFIKESNRIRESELKSYGVIVNSFYELEPDYADFYSKTLGRRAWHIGPVSLCNRRVEEKAAAKNEDECIRWLDSKKQGSVIYICCGSIAYFDEPQLREIAMALEACQQDFIWVVKQVDGDGESLLQEFERKMDGKGLILRGWVPQLRIIEHEATGAFLTHCGWNSTLESIAAGLPMVTWPIFAEQFYNEKLVTEILKIGVPVGAKKWNKKPYIIDLVKHDAIEKALREVMKGDGAKERRNRAHKLKEMAKKAVEVNGSSYSNLEALINELACLKKHHQSTLLK